MNNENCSVCGKYLIAGSIIDEKTICHECLTKEQQGLMNNLSKSEVSHVKGYFSLTEAQSKLFSTTYKKHLSAMGTKMRQRFMPEYLKEVKYDDRENTVNVYFENDWWHYTKDHTWY
ncbi:hypothetical protein LG329_19340 (plasmid) [Virgibacillus necropolis]|uniref:hypothetical protein n=1 Tax=Virgibacillus necropolis TaxID=163877 RepID=UPI00384ACB1C